MMSCLGLSLRGGGRSGRREGIGATKRMMAALRASGKPGGAQVAQAKQAVCAIVTIL